MKSDLSFQLERASWPAFVVAEGGVIRHANPAAVEFFGAKLECEGLLLSALWADTRESADQFLARWENSPAPLTLIKYQGKGGLVSTATTCIAAGRDGHTGQKRFIFQLIPTPLAPPPAASPAPTETRSVVPEASAHKQKLDCAMQLARTVALDFNNALTSVLGHTSLVLTKIEWDHVCRPSLVEVQRAAQKAAEITNQLASFSRQEKESHEHVSGNLNATLRRAVETFQKSAPPSLVWSMQLETQLYAVKFDEAKMQQALSRVIENATESLGHAGCVGVSTRNLDITEPTQDRTAQLQPGSYVCVEITDDGRGIAEDVLPRVFEPFFSTKHGHRGLGLAWVYGIVTNHRGNVAISSQPGQWTSVRVYLPASRKRLMEGGSGNTDLVGNKTILYVDDEELLLTTGQMILSAFGYRVLTANSGEEALELMAKTDVCVDLVITDLVMPRMSGRELIEQLQLRAPGLPVICTSGYVRPAGSDESETYLPKPFTSHELLRCVKQTLATVSADQSTSPQAG